MIKSIRKRDGRLVDFEVDKIAGALYKAFSACFDKVELKKVYAIAHDVEKKEVIMLPLTMASQGETVTIKKIGGKQETKKFLETLGFVVGGTITVVSEINGNMIVNVKDSRVAIGKDMANKIMV